LQAQGVDGEAAPLATIEEMAERYIGAIRTVQPHGPYRIGGSSFGGTVSFEMARQLTAAGEKLELLALIDSPTPSSLTAFAFRSDAEILSYVLARGESPEEHLRQLSAMQDEDQMLRYFLVHGGAGGELDASATVASVRHFLHLFRANYDALVRYRLERCPVRGQFFYASDHDSFNTAGFAQEWASSFAQIDFVGVPGNHISMNLPPNYEPIIEGIMTALLATGATK
jgi:thioesterase domain-containing protein